MQDPDIAEKRYGSDCVVDLIGAHGIDVVAFNPGASFRGIHDSLVNGPGHRPQVITCTHEGVAVAIAHGYAKATGQPMAVMLHNVVGLQLASMSIFNAWVDRVPMLLIGGTGPVSVPARRPWIDWIHTALVQGTQVRDYTKWDDQPMDMASVPESIRRAMSTTVASPPGPVYICIDAGIQEQEAAALDAAELTPHPVPSPAAPSSSDVEWLAEQLVAARMPVIVTDYAGDRSTGFEALGSLANLLQAPVVDAGARFCFPSAHPLNFSNAREVLADADLIIGVDVEDLFRTIGEHALRIDGNVVRKSHDATLVHITPSHYKLRSWASDYQRLMPLDRTISASADAALPALLDACREIVSRSRVEERRSMLEGQMDRMRTRWWEEARAAEDADGIQPARLAALIWDAIRDEEWVLTNGSLLGWEQKLWDFHDHRQHLGWHGGGGLGYGMGAAIGAALALGDERLCINLQPDGDLLFTPSALWTAAHHEVPLLTVVNNNRQYRNSVDHAAGIAAARGRPTDNRYAGTAITDPAVDYAAMARSFGVTGIGPVTSSAEVPAALQEALTVVRSGRPVVVDVVVSGS